MYSWAKVISCPLHACISWRPIMVMQDLSKHFIVDFIYFVKSNMTLFGKTNGRFREGCVIDFSWPKICLLPALKNKMVISCNEKLWLNKKIGEWLYTLVKISLWCWIIVLDRMYNPMWNKTLLNIKDTKWKISKSNWFYVHQLIFLAFM